MSLTRNPLAPARSPSNTYSSSSQVVRITTRTPARAGSAAIARVASMPSITGMRTSIRTMSGRARRASSTAARPSPASPASSRSSSPSSRTRNPARNSAWSSATTTRITGVTGAAWP